MTKFAMGKSAIKIKMEESDDDDDVCFTAVKIEKDSDLFTAPLRNVLEYCLRDRASAYVRKLQRKLQKEGIQEPRHLNLLSPLGIQLLLGAKPQVFNAGEVSDVVETRNAIVRGNSNWQYHGKKGFGKTNYSVRRRSRSPRGSSWHNGKSFDGYRMRKGKQKGQSDSHCLLPELDDSGHKPELWKAVEDGNLDVCRRLLSDLSIDVDETYKLWTPLMKVRINSIGIPNILKACTCISILSYAEM